MNGSNRSFIPLRLTPGAEGIYLRNLNGADELALESTSTKSLVTLLQSLIEGGYPDNNIHAAQIVTADRDRILALLYVKYFGPEVESTIDCGNCDQKFDLDFSINDLLRHYQLQPVEASDKGVYELEPGISFRLPTGEDEMMITEADSAEREKLLLQRCLLEGNPDLDSEKVQLKMAELAPVLSMEMEAVCPECNRTQMLHFDLQTFFMTKLRQERSSLLREVHIVASHYHWSHHEILKLPRKLRKQYVSMILSAN